MEDLALGVAARGMDFCKCGAESSDGAGRTERVGGNFPLSLETRKHVGIAGSPGLLHVVPEMHTLRRPRTARSRQIVPGARPENIASVCTAWTICDLDWIKSINSRTSVTSFGKVDPSQARKAGSSTCSC